MKANKLKKDIAYGLGMKAFKNGKKCVPAYDTLFLDTCIKGCKVGEGTPYLKAWLDGWTDGNLQAEV